MPSSYTLEMGGPIRVGHHQSHSTTAVVVCEMVEFWGRTRGPSYLINIDVNSVIAHISNDMGYDVSDYPLAYISVVGSMQRGGEGGYRVPGEYGKVWREEAGGKHPSEEPEFCKFQWAEIDPRNTHIKYVLLNRCPVGVGVGVCDTWTQTGGFDVPVALMPGANARIKDGIALCIDGWDDEASAYRFRSPRFQKWGTDDHGWIPYRYVTNPRLCTERVAIVGTRGKEIFANGQTEPEEPG